ncbi:MAG TPA: hypothetical protein VFN51_02380 [Candidatus Saccharimonadales bacterium]|nr:hypothetical protein [Candidatus Saccharimonadales bacterium]
MFGHQDDNSGQEGHMDDAAIDALAAEVPNPSTQQNNDDQGQPIPDPSLVTPVTPADDQAGTAAVDESQLKDLISPAGGYPKPPSQRVHLGLQKANEETGDEQPDAQPPEQAPPISLPPNDILNMSPADAANTDLAALKIQALDELYPLIDKLDLHPEEKFRIVMMMLQASDNKDLVKVAYEAAHAIEDEKVKAQALLDIVNEINYFTQPPQA